MVVNMLFKAPEAFVKSWRDWLVDNFMLMLSLQELQWVLVPPPADNVERLCGDQIQYLSAESVNVI